MNQIFRFLLTINLFVFGFFSLRAQENAELDELCDSVFTALQRKSFSELRPFMPGYKTIRGVLDSAKLEKLPHDILMSQKNIEWQLSKDYKKLEKDAPANGLSLQRMELLKTRYSIQNWDKNTYATVRYVVYSNRKLHEIHWYAALLNDDWYLVEGLKYEKAEEDPYAVDFDKIEQEIERKKAKEAAAKQRERDKEQRETERETQKQTREQSADSMRMAREQNKDSLQRTRSSYQDSLQKAREEQKQKLEKERAARKDSIERTKQYRADSIARVREEREKRKPPAKKP